MNGSLGRLAEKCLGQEQQTPNSYGRELRRGKKTLFSKMSYLYI